MYKARCNQMHPLNAIAEYKYVPVRITRGALVAHRYTYAASLHNLAVPQDFCFLSVFLRNDLADPVFDGVLLAGFKSRANAFLLA